MQITFDEKKRLDTNPIFNLFVQGENMAESIRIVGPKMVGALDLSQLRMAVRVTSAAYETMVEKTLEQTVSDEGTITLVWHVDRQFTSNPGHVRVMLVGYGNNEEVIKITSSGIEVKEDETFISAPQGNTWEQILREMQELATQAKNSQTAAAASATSAAASEQVAISKAAETENAAEQTVVNAKVADTSATLAKSWAVGGTGTRPGEDTDNAQYYAQQAQSIAGGQLGWFDTEQALQAAHPTGTDGQWAIIGSTDTIWTWDSDTSAWVNTGDSSDLSNYYTKAQADAAFATAAQGTLAASAVQSVNGKTGTAVTLAPQDVGGISTYTCITSGTTHALTGTGSNIKFVADAAFEAGDTITVNGQAVTAQTQDGATLAAGAWASGATVACWLNGTVLTVSGAGSEFEYSTTEQPTGEKWVNGEPVYVKAWSVSNPATGTNTISHLTSIAHVISFGGEVIYGDGIINPVPHVGNSETTFLDIADISNAQFAFLVGPVYTGSYAISNATIWIKFTKS